MKFEEVPSGSYLIKGNTVIDKEEWDTLPTNEKTGWYLAERRRVKVEALKVINHIIDDMVEQGIEEMEWDVKFTKATLKVKDALDIIPLEDVEKNDRN